MEGLAATLLGGRSPRPVDVRVIAATNKNLEREVEAGRFREDLHWRLNVVPIQLPALRERREDLPLLIDHFLDHLGRELGLGIPSLAPDARRLLLDYDWPGNVRELENTVRRAMVLCEDDVVRVADLPGRVRGEPDPDLAGPERDLDRMPLAEAVSAATERLEKRMILARLAAHHGSRSATAESLGVSRKTLFNKMRQYALSDEDLESPG